MPFFRPPRAPWLSRLAGWPRRALAVACLGAAALSLVVHPAHDRASAATDSTPTLVAARPLPAGRVLVAGDLQLARWPTAIAPANRLTELRAGIGRSLGAAMSTGEPLTTSRLLETAISGALDPSEVAVAVTLREPGPARIVQAGATVDLYAAPPSAFDDESSAAAGGEDKSIPKPLISAARVLAVVASTADDDASGPASAGVSPTVVLAVKRTVVGRLAGQPIDTVLATLRPAQ